MINFNNRWELETVDGCYTSELCIFVSLNEMWFVSQKVSLLDTSELNN